MGELLTIAELAERVGGNLRGDGSTRIRGIGSIQNAQPDQITWLTSEKYASALPACRAGGILVPENFGPTPMPAILCRRMDEAVATVLDLFAAPRPRIAKGIHPTAVIDSTAELGGDVVITPV